MSDLVERLRDLASQRHRDRGVDAVDDAMREAADRLDQLERELETANGLWTFWNDKATELAGKLAEARRYAFFVGWEMSETGGMEDTCADAWAFWSLMEDERDEAEGRANALRQGRKEAE